MARTTGTASLADLLENGTLRPNEPIEVRRRSAPAIAGKVTKDGDVAVGNLVFKSPSAAACHALNAGSADGWLRWRVPRLGGKSLAELRDAS